MSKLVLVSSIVPQAMQSATSPDGIPPAVIESFRTAMLKDRAQFFLDVPTGPFFGFNRTQNAAAVSQGLIQSWFVSGMQAGFKAVYETTHSWEVDYTDDLKGLTIPVLAIHGTDDQIVPFKTGGPRVPGIAKNGKVKVYEGGAHALPNTEPEKINADLWEFIQA